MVCLDMTFAIENPGQSLVVHHPRLIQMFKKLQKAGIKVACLVKVSLVLVAVWGFGETIFVMSLL